MLQKLWRKQLLRLGLSSAFGVFCLSVALACTVAHWGFIQSGITIGAICFGGFCIGLVLQFKTPFSPTKQVQAQLAQFIEELVPELGSAASSAVHFEKATDIDDSTSEDLINEHIVRTHKIIQDSPFEERLTAHFLRRQKQTMLFAGAALVISLGLIGALEKGRTRLTRALFHPNAIQISSAPLAGDIRLVYHYPAYTNMGSVVIEGGNGSIRALVGTQIEIQATTEKAVLKAELRQSIDGTPNEQILPMTVDNKHTVRARFSVMATGRYSFVLHTEEGEHLQDKQWQPIVALPDAYPYVKLDSPLEDIEIRDNQTVPILWQAKDDYGVAEINLVVEPDTPQSHKAPTPVELIRIPLGQVNQIDKRREGRFTWALTTLELAPGQGATFYLEAIDNDPIQGPKRSTSQKRRLNVFSAKLHHEKVILAQNKVLDAMVDWLGQELENPVKHPLKTSARASQEKIVTQILLVKGLLQELVINLSEDELAKTGVPEAFDAIVQHTETAYKNRTRQLKRLLAKSKKKLQVMVLENYQNQAVEQLEKDIIYVDDLLAIQRIDELKNTASQLLAAQNELQDLLGQYKKSQDPKLRSALEQRIQSLRKQMLELLQKMSQIKKHLPGEYRNMEASSMLKIDDQLNRLESMLQEDDLEGAAKELEQLANMIEQMVDSIEEAEEEYGGERYEAIREDLNRFSQSFQELERQQAALSKRTDELLEEYRKKSMQKTGNDIDKFIKKIRELTSAALLGLEPLAELSFKIHDNLRSLDNTRQRLADLDALAEQRDLAEARLMGQQALQSILAYQNKLIRHTLRFGERQTQEMKNALETTADSRGRIVKIKEELDKLFPDPEDILSPEQLAQMKNMAQKQGELQKQAQEMQNQMQELSQEVPLFGGEPRQSLENAKSHMQQAQKRLGQGELSKAARSERMALEQLGKLRKALEQSTKGNQGGLPMPLGSSGKSGGRRGNSGGFSKENVELPQTQSKKETPRFRQELLDAAKQKAPKRYEDAVRKYYEELIK